VKLVPGAGVEGKPPPAKVEITYCWASRQPGNIKRPERIIALLVFIFPRIG
jgi:hypothetical protein